MHRRSHLVRSRSALAFLLMLAAGLPQCADADESSATLRLREMLHRTQEALRQAQSENAELTRAKSETEQKLEAALKELDAARGVSKTQLALRGQLETAKAAEDEQTRKLGEANAALGAANAKLNEAGKQLIAGQGELARVKTGLEQATAADAACEDKNLKLYSYAQEVLQAYKKKGVWAALSQKDPVLGLKEVEVENVVQEYQAKFSAEKVRN